MVGKSFCALGLILVFSGAAHAAVIGGGVFNPANGHTYYLLEKKSWTASEAEAVTLGGHLVAVNNAAENQFLLDMFCSGPNDKRILWIGLTDAGTEGQFRWTTGEPVTYTNWFPGEPNNRAQVGGAENYVSFNWNYAFAEPDPSWPRGTWNDDVDTGFPQLRHPPPAGPFFGVAEIVPEPSTLLAACAVGLALISRRRA